MNNKSLLVLFGLLLFLSGCVLGFILFNPDSIPTRETFGNKPVESYDIIVKSNSGLFYFDYVIHKSGPMTNGYFYSNNSWSDINPKNISISVKPLNNGNNREYTFDIKLKTDTGETDIYTKSVNLDMTVRADKLFPKFGGFAYNTVITFTKTDGTSYVETGKSAVLAGYDWNYKNINLQELGVKTTWIMFMDKDNNFYHLDITTVAKDNDDYKSHSFFSFDKGDSVSYSTGFSVENNSTDVVINSSEKALKLVKSVPHDVAYFKDANLFTVSDNSGGVGILLSIGK